MKEKKEKGSFLEKNGSETSDLGEGDEEDFGERERERRGERRAREEDDELSRGFLRDAQFRRPN